jgi:hypothetical protein
MNLRRDGSRLPLSPADSADPNPPSPSPPATRPDPTSAALVEISVALVEKAAKDLQITHERTHLSKTDIVNRAVSLYEFVDAELSAGAEFIVCRDGQNYLVKLM